MAESQIELPSTRRINGAWPRALAWGFGAALVHRLLLGVWLALIWTTLSQWTQASVNFHDPHGLLPPLTTTAEQLVFGVWRRWDAIHYLDLALHGYQLSNPGPTVFGVLTPFSFRAFDLALPGGIDLAALVFQTLAFGAALTFLYRSGETYFKDARLGQWAVIVTALLPLSYFFEAPMSDTVYLALTLALFYFCTRRRWLMAAICGFLATLARSQGVLLLPFAALMLLEQQGFRLREPREWPRQLIAALRQGWILALIPLGFVVFVAYRASLNLPPINDVYLHYSYKAIADPITGLIINLRHFITDPASAFVSIDLLALALSLILSFVALAFPRQRRLPLVFYNFAFILVFVTQINYAYGTQEISGTQSIGRYSLALFPQVYLVADGLIQAKPVLRVIGVCILCFGVLAFSGLYVMALSGP